MLFSIIVPMYNVEKYLEKCVTSILEQSFSDYEVILVDDYSTDDTVKIAEKFATNNNFRLIKKPYNSGLSETRNIGIKNACGEYLIFVDSDDYIEKDSLKIFSEIIGNHNPDVLYAGFFQEYDDGKCEKKHGFTSVVNKKYSAIEYMYSELRNRNLFAAAAFGIYKRKKILDNSLFFKKGILHEDEEWTPRVLMNVETVFLSEFEFYHYLKREGSITTKRDRTKNGLDLMQTCIDLELYAKEHLKEKKLLKLYNNQLAKLYMKAVCIGEIYREEYKKGIDRFFPLKHAHNAYDIFKATLFFINVNFYARLDKICGDDWR